MFSQLIQWSQSEYTHLPWRKKRNLYRTLVSEIMLQQTTVGTVVKHFSRFMEKYPNLKSLSQASEEEMTKAWEGLGYYRRARNLRKAAITLQEKYAGQFPLNLQELLALPGFGQYTACALLAIGANRRALAVDANVERVLARIFALREEKGMTLQKKLLSLFEEKKILKDLDILGPRKLNEALMDLGRVFCQAKQANCILCPVQRECQSFQQGLDPLALPFVSSQKKIKNKRKFDLALIRIVIKRGNKILAYTKSSHEWLSGQIELPTLLYQSEDKQFKQYPCYCGRRQFKGLPEIKSHITKYKIKNLILECGIKELSKLGLPRQRYRYFDLADPQNHFTSTTLKILKREKK